MLQSLLIDIQSDAEEIANHLKLSTQEIENGEDFLSKQQHEGYDHNSFQKLDIRQKLVHAYCTAHQLAKHFATEFEVVENDDQSMHKMYATLVAQKQLTQFVGAVFGLNLRQTELSWEQLRKNKSEHGRKAALARHTQPGGFKTNKEKLIEIYKSGKYKLKKDCANAHHAKFGVTVEIACKWLSGVPNPQKN